jgi:hypothetical protein
MALRHALAKDPAERTPDVVTLGREFAAALRGVAPDCVPPPAPGGMANLAEVFGASPDTVASSPAAPVPRHVPLTALEAGGRRVASGSPIHDAGPSPAAANQVPPAQVASAAQPAWMPRWPTGDQPARPGAALASPMATGSVLVPTRRSRGRAILALAVACIAAALVATGIVLGVRAGSSNGVAAGEATIAASHSPPPAPASQPADEVAIVFAVEPTGAEVALRVDGVLVTDRPLRRTRSRTPLMVTAEAAGYLPFRAEPVPDRDQIVDVRLQPSPAAPVKRAPPRHATAPVGASRNETHPRSPRASTSAAAGSSAATPDPASPKPEPPASRPRYVPSASVTGQVPPGSGSSSSPGREASAPPDAGGPKGPAGGSAAPQQPGARPAPQVPAPQAPAPVAPPPATTPPKPPPKTGTIFDNP